MPPYATPKETGYHIKKNPQLVSLKIHKNFSAVQY